MRSRLLENHRELASSLFLNFGIAFDQALKMKRSEISTIFESKAFREWKQSREASHKIDAAVVERLDILIRAIGSLGKALVAR